MLEAGGTSAHDALLVSAGIRASEIEALRARANQLKEEMEEAEQREAQLQRALDQSMTAIALRDKELKDTRQILNKTAETEKGSRQSIVAFDRQVTELKTTIAACEEKLARTISTAGLNDDALATLSMFRDRLGRGEGLAEAALGSVGYRAPDVDAALAKQDRHEVRAFEALLAGPSWRRRFVLWLLGGTKKR